MKRMTLAERKAAIAKALELGEQHGWRFGTLGCDGASRCAIGHLSSAVGCGSQTNTSDAIFYLGQFGFGTTERLSKVVIENDNALSLKEAQYTGPEALRRLCLDQQPDPENHEILELSKEST